jgi:hypothetical protein
LGESSSLNVAGPGRFYQNAQMHYAEITNSGLLWTGPDFYRFRFQNTTGTTDIMTLHTNGKIGVGTGTEALNGDFLFYINGKMLSEEHTVKLKTDWPDYVFEEDYELMSIEALESFIKENRHLPDVPSAADVAENGVEMGATQAALLKQIEELTLRLIEMDKRIKQLESLESHENR